MNFKKIKPLLGFVIFTSLSYLDSLHASESTSEVRQAFYLYADLIQEPVKKLSEYSKKMIKMCQYEEIECGVEYKNQSKHSGPEIEKLAQITFERYNTIKAIKVNNDKDQEFKNLALKEIHDANLMWTKDGFKAVGGNISMTRYDLERTLFYSKGHFSTVAGGIYATVVDVIFIPTIIVADPIMNDLPMALKYIFNRKDFDEDHSIIIFPSAEAQKYRLNPSNTKG